MSGTRKSVRLFGENLEEGMRIRAQAHDAPRRVLPVTTGSSADMRQVDT